MLDFDLLVFAFGQFPLVVVSWICMFVSALVVPFVLLRWWAAVRSSSNHPTFCSLIAATLLLLYQSLGLGFLPTYVVLRNSLPPASCFILILEQVRKLLLQLSPGSSLTSSFILVLNLTLPLNVFRFLFIRIVPVLNTEDLRNLSAK